MNPDNKTYANLKMVAATFSMAYLTACGHSLPVKEFPDSASATDETQKLSTDIDAARAAQVNATDPSDFRDAEDSLRSAQKKRENKGTNQEVLHEVAQGRAHLDRAKDVNQAAATDLAPVLQARQAAIKADAPKFQADQLKDADSDLNSIAKNYQGGNMNVDMKERARVQQEYLQIELVSIKYRALHDSYVSLKKAEDNGAEKNASRSLAKAKQELANADAFITANRHDQAGITAASLKASTAVNELNLVLARLHGAKGMDSEEMAMQSIQKDRTLDATKTELNQTNQELTATTAQVGQANAQLRDAQGNLRDAQGNLIVMSEENKKLEREKQFDLLYTDARRMFRPDEAEVLRDGHRLVIRLKDMKFPVAKSEIPASRYELLGRVDEVIGSFDDAKVAVEGHTDATGSKAVNQKLSEERARSVANYLIQTGDLVPGDVNVQGMGDTRPIASNKSADDRAKNRRVDIIISPISRTADGKNAWGDVDSSTKTQ